MDKNARVAFLTLMISVSAAGEGLGQVYSPPPPPIPASLPAPRMPDSLRAPSYGGARRPRKHPREAPLQTVADRANLMEKQAETELRAGDWRQAEATCRRALVLSPAPTACWAIMGNARYSLGDFSGARDAFEMAVRINAEDVPAIGRLGVTLARLDQREEAGKWLGILRSRFQECRDDCPSQAAIQEAIAEIALALSTSG